MNTSGLTKKEKRELRLARGQAEMIRLIQKWAELYGEPPKASDWKAVKDPAFIAKYGEWPSFLTAARYGPDGTWDGIIRAAGFEPRGRGQPSKLDWDGAGS